MKTKAKAAVALSAFLIGILGQTLLAAEKTAGNRVANPAHMQWWQDAKFGVFVHWGPSSIAKQSISWSRNGPRPGHPSKHAQRGTPVEVYDNLYKEFNPVRFDADAWAKMIKDSGAGYLIFTAKHHDGFCMFDSANTDYDIMSTPFKRDICKELAAACHKHGIKVFWYYSQPDWHHPDYKTDNHDRYIAFLHNQLRELCTKYGKVAGIWFDGLGMPPENWDSEKMIPMLRELQPGVIINHRYGGRHLMKQLGDFDTAENHIGHFQVDRPWESCIKIGGPWSWGGYDRSGQSAETCLRTLIQTAGRGGNLALNTGPSPLGEIHPEDVKVYLAIGKWLKDYGESIYGTRGGPYKPGPWGVCTHKGDNVYLHVMQLWPDGELILTTLGRKVASATALAGGKPTVRQDSNGIRITLPAEHHNSLDTIIALKLDGDAAAIAPIETQPGASLTVGCSATASSENKNRPAAAAIASDVTTFEEGAYTKSFWQPGAKDKSPWLCVDLGKPQTFDRICIREKQGNISAFRIETCDQGEWKIVYRSEILGDLSLRIRPTTAREVRLVIEKCDRSPGILAFDLFAPGTHGKLVGPSH